MAAIDRRTRARKAIQSVAAGLGYPTDLNILSERWNTVARLGESNVIAKAATLASLARLNPQHWFQQEVRVSTALAQVGAPVQSPWSDDHAFSVVDDIPITLWHRIEGETAGSSETEMVDSLARIHRLGGEIVLDQPWFATITVEIPGALTMLTNRGVLTGGDDAQLRDYLVKLLDVVSAANMPTGLVHGDAQRKNSLHTAQGTIWIDLEETCTGPFAWDLACLTMNPRFDTGRVLDRYADVSGTNRTSEYHLQVLKQLRELEGLVWMLAIQDERETAFRQDAAQQFSRVLLAASVG